MDNIITTSTLSTLTTLSTSSTSSTSLTINKFIPNEEQLLCIKKVNSFISTNKPFSKLLINGSAGTGKTTIIISSIINIILEQITINIVKIKHLIVNQNETLSEKAKANNIVVDKFDFIKNFIVSAPTNKAKDVLVTKYNSYIEEQLDIHLDTYLEIHIKQNVIDKNVINKQVIIQILNNRITFLTVSQVLSISRVINEVGVEEFTKGNDKKIIDKYNSEDYNDTTLIVDECSMIDINTSKLLSLIKCPIIYIGDYCQLPPINEELSSVFSDYTNNDNNDNSNDSNCFDNTNDNYITLKNVERCKNNVTLVANILRNKIYNTLSHFNLLEHKNIDIITYNKQFSKWLESYIINIKNKQKKLYVLDSVSSNTDNTDNTITVQDKTNTLLDTMILGWTNNCCTFLNKKVRNLLFDTIKNINKKYIIKGDKLIIKTPYYKYGKNIYSSTIMYVLEAQITKFKPFTFKEWCSFIIEDNNLNDSKKSKGKGKSIDNSGLDSGLDSRLDININDILDTNTNNNNNNDKSNLKPIIKHIIKPLNKTPLSILDYFDKMSSTNIVNMAMDNNDIDNHTNTTQSNTESKTLELQHKEIENTLKYRKLFYKIHKYNDITSCDNYNFTDELSLNPEFNLLIPNCELNKIKYLSTSIMRYNAYTKWHKAMSIKLFGIPNDKICCKKCSFFVNRFLSKIKQNGNGNGNGNSNSDSNDGSIRDNISNFINATEALEFDMYLCDLVTFKASGKCVSNNIPIIDLSKQCNIEALDRIRNIIKISNDVKITLSRQEEFELKTINKAIGEEEYNKHNLKYISISQLFGHYMSHVITSSYLEIDYGYVLTIHKSQGSTYDDVYIEYNNILSNNKEIEKDKLLYTAITRSANKLHIYI